MKQTIELPFAPSVNHYWRHVACPKGIKVLVSEEGKLFREAVGIMCVIARLKPMDGRLGVLIEVFPPDRRGRDIDNLAKSTLDALQKAGVYQDDEHIDDLHVIRKEVCKGGKIVVTLWEI
jgi:crossover junction endodeoxyribonuclease RusA